MTSSCLRARRRGLSILSVVILTVITFAFSAGSALAAPGDPFDSAQPQVFVSQYDTATLTTQLYRAVADGSGAVNLQPEGPPAPLAYNAIGFNPADRYLYGVVGRTDTNTPPGFEVGALIRIGESGAITRVGTERFLFLTPTGFQAGPNLGAFGDDGLLYLMSSNNLTLRVVDVATGTQVVSRTLSRGITPVPDVTFADGFLWGASDQGYLWRMTTTGQITVFTQEVIPPLPTGRSSYGAAWTFGNGNLGFSRNEDGSVFQVEVSNPASDSPTFRLVSQQPGPTTFGNDGTAIPGSPTDLSITKTRTAPAGDLVPPGGDVTYRLTVTNESSLRSSGFTVTDALPASLTNARSSTPGCTVNGATVTCVGGVLPPGGTADIAITATVVPSAQACWLNTATVLANEEDPAGGNDSASVETCPGQPVVNVTKDVTPSSDVRAGDVVTYTVVARNAGNVDYVAGNPAVVTDDLTAVLDDGTFLGSSASAGPAPTLTGSRLVWSGPLATGASVTLTYRVQLTNGGDGTVTNLVFEGSGATPTCTTGTLDRQPPLCAVSQLTLPRLQVTKTADASAIASTGRVSYALSITNPGPGPYSEDRPASVTDDLTDVLDAATLDEASLTTDVGDVSLSGNRLTWTGPLAAGQTATVRYTVTYTGAGDADLVNTLCAPADQVPAGRQPCTTVSTSGPVVDRSKTVTPSGRQVRTGDQLTYRLEFANRAGIPLPVSAVDDLAFVLDDARLVEGVTTSRGLSASLSGNRLLISGSVPGGETGTVSYTVQVLPQAQRGDGIIANVLLAAGQAPPTAPACPSGDDCTITTVAADPTTPPPPTVAPISAPGAPVGPPVSAGPGTLASTGSEPVGVVATALVMVAAGAGLMAARRLRRRA